VYLLIAVVLTAVVVGVGLVTLLERKRVEIPDYADPDVEEVPVEDLLSDAGESGKSSDDGSSAGPGLSGSAPAHGRWDRLG
jgi:hypothetical protein